MKKKLLIELNDRIQLECKKIEKINEFVYLGYIITLGNSY